MSVFLSVLLYKLCYAVHVHSGTCVCVCSTHEYAINTVIQSCVCTVTDILCCPACVCLFCVCICIQWVQRKSPFEEKDYKPCSRLYTQYYKDQWYIAATVSDFSAVVCFRSHDCKEWTPVDTSALESVDALAASDTLIVMYGRSSKDSSWYIYKLVDDCFTVLSFKSKHTVTQCYPAMYVTDDHVVLLGGKDKDDKPLCVSYSFQMSTEEWSCTNDVTTSSVLPALPSASARSAANVVHAGGNVYVVGGLNFPDAQDNLPALVLEADGGAKKPLSWQPVHALPETCVCGSLGTDNCIVVAGGYDCQKKCARSECSVVNVLDNTITVLPALPFARQYPVLLLCGTTLICGGGANGIEWQSDLYELDLSL